MKHHKLTASLLIACSLASTAVGSNEVGEPPRVSAVSEESLVTKRTDSIKESHDFSTFLTIATVGTRALMAPSHIANSKSKLGAFWFNVAVIGLGYLTLKQLGHDEQQIMFLDGQARESLRWNKMNQADKHNHLARAMADPKGIYANHEKLLMAENRLAALQIAQTLATAAIVVVPMYKILRRPSPTNYYQYLLDDGPSPWLSICCATGTLYLFISLNYGERLAKQVNLASKLNKLEMRLLEVERSGGNWQNEWQKLDPSIEYHQ